jgi:hypothetical protein
LVLAPVVMCFSYVFGYILKFSKRMQGLPGIYPNLCFKKIL